MFALLFKGPFVDTRSWKYRIVSIVRIDSTSLHIHGDPA
jgi:hypothetical protein